MNPTRPFNLDDLRFEKKRLAKRRKLLLISLVPCLLLLVCAVKFLSIPILSGNARQSYSRAQYSNTIGMLQPLLIANWFEPYVAQYDQGNAYYQQAEYASAEGSFRIALETVPAAHECDVRINLVLAIVAQADAMAGKKQFDQAIVRYDDAKAVLYDGQVSCGIQFTAAPSQSNSNKQNAKDAQALNKQVQEKSNQAKAARNGDKASQSSDETTDKGDATQSKLDKLERQATNAQKQRTAQQQTNRNMQQSEKNTPSRNTKNW